jgi:hypothetical protein
MKIAIEGKWLFWLIVLSILTTTAAICVHEINRSRTFRQNCEAHQGFIISTDININCVDKHGIFIRVSDGANPHLTNSNLTGDIA